MRKIRDDDGVRELNITDLIAEFEDDVRDLDSDDMDGTEYQLITSQYAYVKFGLILEKIRNRSWWAKCTEKFKDFRQFCQTKVNLNIWQVTNAIKSAQVAVKLAWLRFTELPRNASQALKLADLSIERLGEVWGNVVASCEGHKITALAIESQINPDKVATSETLRLPRRVADALRGQAIAAGMSLSEYLEELASIDVDRDDEDIELVSQPIEINAEMSAIIDRVEYQWLKPAAPKQILSSAIDSFDRLMSDLTGIIPGVRRVANE
jgi:hypothetical protein